MRRAGNAKWSNTSAPATSYHQFQVNGWGCKCIRLDGFDLGNDLFGHPSARPRSRDQTVHDVAGARLLVPQHDLALRQRSSPMRGRAICDMDRRISFSPVSRSRGSCISSSIASNALRTLATPTQYPGFRPSSSRAIVQAQAALVGISLSADGPWVQANNPRIRNPLTTDRIG
jgi:hypothetical protein